jgi:23S rRNA pseudouridine2457 synthase
MAAARPGGHRYFLVYKPWNMVSQFVSVHDVPLLGSIDFRFPEGTHAIGRLDKDSEGLLLLTTDKRITKLLFNGTQPHFRRYLVQVRFDVKEETVAALAKGIDISAPAGSVYRTSPCQVERIDKPAFLPPAGFPIHEKVQSSWLSITLTEGKYHQVRKMVAAVNHKCIRLVRISIEGIELGDLQPGGVRELSREEFYQNLNI